MTTATAPLTPENIARAEQDDREWMAARLHAELHGSWLGPDECPGCSAESRDGARRVRMTTMARDGIDPADLLAIEDRAQALGVSIGTMYSARHREWIVSVDGGPRLRAKGSLVAILTGLLDDVEAAR